MNTKLAVGTRIGQWTVLVPFYRSLSGHACATVKCTCGTVRDVRLNLLENGKSLSCGCTRRNHGLFAQPLYQEWRKIIKQAKNLRCGEIIVPHGKSVKDLRIDPTWKASFRSFGEFAKDSGYKQGLRIRRVNKRHGFFPWNCEWYVPEYKD